MVDGSGEDESVVTSEVIRKELEEAQKGSVTVSAPKSLVKDEVVEEISDVDLALRESAMAMRTYLKGVLDKEIRVGERIDKNLLALWKEYNNLLNILKPKEVRVEHKHLRLEDIHRVMRGEFEEVE